MPRPRRATRLRRNNPTSSPDERVCAHSSGISCSKRRNTMNIHLAGSRPTRLAPKEYFTGTVWQDPIIATEAPARIVSNCVSFEPGARTNWHSHPLGQALYVIAGVGRIQSKGQPVREIRPGD